MNDRPRSSSGNAFVLGMIVGGGLVFLLGTKKGRALLKQFSEHGLEILENLENVNQHEEEAGEEVVEPTEDQAIEVKENGNGHSIGKRFFKGIKRKR